MKAAAGDMEAFEAIYRIASGYVYTVALKVTGSREDAEEVTQDAFIRAHRGLANFRGDSAFSTWLYQIATNLARNRYWYWWRRYSLAGRS